jgi:diguanylate cyclase (GGDEF)-like protein
VRANEQLQEELCKAEAQLKHQAEEIEAHAAVARTDALTGLCNRRGFDDELNRRYAERLRHNSIFSLLMMDVDDFKRINDVYGHPSGDEVLRTLAALLTGTFREMDLVARYGGEEFAIILPATHLRDATVAAERIRRAVIEPRYWVKGEKLQLTVSFGVAQVAQRVGPAQLVARADAALYAAKSSGRNRTFVHDGQSCNSADVLLSHPSSGNAIALPVPPQPAGAAGKSE